MSHNDDQPQELVHDPSRPHSFDLTLELERQLENESLPNSPAYNGARPQSLDPHVLASIVTNLRVGMAELTKERDELTVALEASRRKEHDLSDEVHRMTEKQAELEEELGSLRKKSQEDDDSIVLLRSKVEESRRGLMRLQTENRRASRGGDMSVDLSRAGSYSFGGPNSGKRTSSFAPLTGTPMSGRMHRRISSVSDSNTTWSEPVHTSLNTSPNGQTITLPDMSPPPSHAPPSSRRFSGMFGRPVPEVEPAGNLEVEMLQREIKTLKGALEETRHELTEATEAREASDTCVKALRDFIAENSVGDDRGGGLAPPPINTRLDDSDRKSTSSAVSGNASRWGFGLWRAGESSASASPVARTSTSSPVVARAIPPPPGPAEPLTRKLGGFFTGRGSVSSITGTPPRVPTVQEAMYNGSDTSSSAESTEPISPTSEQQQVLTRVASGDSGSSSRLPEIFGKGGENEGGIKVVA
ncbi:hypothetical protein BV25DRAFT_1798455 [Artomyces pyxidatus]|uniref:Uncharacterized protein n=1 Tax=Artomyces pyxidatus TaxID=48021 RepID=A0ACB8TBR9_9AGAM|nr:hypothetical protein BV25DRAFT_1798455 [Artomyces pyxidatus]